LERKENSGIGRSRLTRATRMDGLHVDIAGGCARTFSVGRPSLDEGHIQAGLGELISCRCPENPSADYNRID